jgi:iron(III) transport system permease protein
MTSTTGRDPVPFAFSGSRLARDVRRLASGRTLIVAGCVLIVGFLAIVPLFYLIRDTFTGPGGFTLGAFSRAYGGRSQAGEMLGNSLAFAVGAALLALVLGTVLAYIQVRTDTPFKGLFFAASLVPLIIPAILYAAAWIFLADPDIGLLNAVLKPVFGHGTLNVFSLWGMMWVQGLHLAPIAFLLMVAAFRAMDPSLEESALMSGASRTTVLRRITMPLMRPALVSAVLLMFVQSLESFEVPGLLGLQNGTYVFTSPIDYGAAGAYAVGLLVIAAVGVLVSGWLSRDTKGFQTISGKGFRPRPIELGRARPWIGTAVVVYFAVTVVLPIGVLIYTSLLGYYTAPSKAALKSMSLANYREALHLPLASTALKNSLLLGIASATVVMFITAVASWVIVRTKAPGRRLLDLLAFSPIVIPGLVLGLALSFVYLRSPLPIYGTLWILLLSYSTRYLPYGMRYATSAMTQLSAELEESAQVCGAGWWQTFRRVLLPLTSSGIVAGWIYILVVSFRELSSTILLYSPGKEVLSVLIWEQFEDGKFTLLAAIGVLMVAILVLLVLVAYRIGAGVGLKTDD